MMDANKQSAQEQEMRRQETSAAEAHNGTLTHEEERKDASSVGATQAKKELGETMIDHQQQEMAKLTSQSTISPLDLSLMSANSMSPSLSSLATKSTQKQADSEPSTDPLSREGAEVEKPTKEDAPRQEVMLTPEQRRLANLRSKESSLTKSLAQLSHQRDVLLLQLASALPQHMTRDLVLDTNEPDYTPSTLAHTTPSLAEVDIEDTDVLMKEAHKIIKQHINLLHEYNEIKDVAQGLIGMIADQRGVRVVDCQSEFGVDAGD